MTDYLKTLPEQATIGDVFQGLYDRAWQVYAQIDSIDSQEPQLPAPLNAYGQPGPSRIGAVEPEAYPLKATSGLQAQLEQAWVYEGQAPTGMQGLYLVSRMRVGQSNQGDNTIPWSIGAHSTASGLMLPDLELNRVTDGKVNVALVKPIEFYDQAELVEWERRSSTYANLASTYRHGNSLARSYPECMSVEEILAMDDVDGPDLKRVTDAIHQAINEAEALVLRAQLNAGIPEIASAAPKPPKRRSSHFSLRRFLPVH